VLFTAKVIASPEAAFVMACLKEPGPALSVLFTAAASSAAVPPKQRAEIMRFFMKAVLFRVNFMEFPFL